MTDTHRDLRPDVMPDQAREVIARHIGAPVTRIWPLEGGQIARILAFTAGGDDLVLRLNPPTVGGTAREAFVLGLLAGTGVPVATPLHRGTFGELSYTIAPLMPGRPLGEMEHSEIEALLPELADLLDTVHAVEDAATTGFSYIGDDGNGTMPTWRRFLVNVADELPYDFFGQWHGLFETSFLDRSLFDALFARMTALTDACPNERWLVHGDVGFDNVLAEHGRITAILDWQNAAWGDPLYDIAQIDFWYASIGWVARDRARREARGGLPARYADRIACYQCRTGLDAMKFFAHQGNEGAYRFTVDRIRELRLIADPM